MISIYQRLSTHFHGYLLHYYIRKYFVNIFWKKRRNLHLTILSDCHNISTILELWKFCFNLIYFFKYSKIKNKKLPLSGVKILELRRSKWSPLHRPMSSILLPSLKRSELESMKLRSMKCRSVKCRSTIQDETSECLREEEWSRRCRSRLFRRYICSEERVKTNMAKG